MCRRQRCDFGESDRSRAAFDVRRPFKLNISAFLFFSISHSMGYRWENKRGMIYFYPDNVICYFNQITNRCREEGDRRGIIS